MISVTAKEFTANIHEFLDNVDNQDIRIVREGKKPIILTVPKEGQSPAQQLRDVVGPIDLPDDFDHKKAEQERLWEKYESLD